MIIFIDESGDSGFKFEKGSSKLFVIVCIVFEDELEAEKAAVAIKELKRKLGFSDKTEFKFNGSNKTIRLQFLKTIKPFAFSIRAVLVKKEIIRSHLLRKNKNSFYSYFIKSLLSNTGGAILDAKVRIDGSGDRLFRQNFATYLRRELNTRDRKVLHNLRLVDSKTNVLIQLADMVAGTIRRYKEGEKTDSVEYWKVIKDKINDCWDFQ